MRGDEDCHAPCALTDIRPLHPTSGNLDHDCNIINMVMPEARAISPSASVLLVLLEVFKGIDGIKVHLRSPEYRRPSDVVVIEKGKE